MRRLPLADPGTPDLRSPLRFLGWVGRGQISTLLGGMTFGVTWMVAMALTPAAIGEAINAGIKPHDTHALVLWLSVIAGLVLIQAASAIARHRFAVTNWLMASFRCAQLLGDHMAAASTPVTSTVAAGDVVNTLGSDAMRIGTAFDVSARFVGSIVSYLVVAVIMLHYSVTLGLIIMFGVPILVFGITPLIKPLQQRQREVRDATGDLSILGADTVAGLRILRGVGGESAFLARYVDQSQRVRSAGMRAAGPQAALDAAQVAFPALFILIVTWVGAHLALTHQITLGQLVAFYGFSVFLVAPLTTATEFVQGATRAHVGAAKLIRILSIPPTARSSSGGSAPTMGAGLSDPDTGVVIDGGSLTALVATTPDRAVDLAERLGGFRSSHATFGGVALHDMSLTEVRRRIVVSEPDPQLFSGPLLDELSGDDVDRLARVAEALEVASALDVIEALPDGLDSHVEERGRSLSGGQRQRLALARALLTQAEVLILIEPTSAVDAHTERRIAERLRSYRAGRTTVVVTSSPLMLDVCDQIAFLDDTNVDHGTHHELLSSNPAYRDTVLRGEDA